MVDLSALQSVSNIADFVYSDSQGILYIVTSDGSLVRWSVASNAFLSPVALGGNLTSIDISPDGSFLLVGRRDMISETVQGGDYVGHTAVYRISTNSMAVTPLDLTVTQGERGVADISIGVNNTALLTTDYAGSGWTKLHRFDATAAVIGAGGVSGQSTVRGSSYLLGSEDHRYTLIQEADDSSNPTELYDSQTGTVIARASYLGWGIGVGDVDSGSQRIATVGDSIYVTDFSLHAVQTINPSGMSQLGVSVAGLQFTSSAHQLLVWNGAGHKLLVFDILTGTELAAISVSDASISNPRSWSARPTMQLSGDGHLLFLHTQSGVEVVDLSARMSLSVNGASGSDVLWGNVGADTLNGNDGDDVLGGGANSDTLNGGLGRDTATYADSSSGGVTVSLAIAGPQDTGAAGIDTLISIENLTGTAFADTLTGDGSDNVLTGGGGDDVLTGNGGADIFVVEGFGLGTDHITDFSAGDRIDLSALHISSLQALTPFMRDAAGNAVIDFGASGAIVIENVSVASLGAGSFIFDTSNTATTVTGTDGADALILGPGGGQANGLAGDDVIHGGAGADTLDGGPGNDILDGAGGPDTASYASATAGVRLSLLIGGPQDTVGAGIDSLISIENLKGSSFDDLLIGDAGPNILDGGLGVDTTSYAFASSAVIVDLSLTGPQDTGGGGVDTLLSIETVIGSAFGDTLRGGPGANLFDGGGGVDTVSYANATSAVTASLALAGPQQTGGGGLDTLISIENLIGSTFNDTLTSSAGNNRIDGGGGYDTVSYAAAGSGVRVDLGRSAPQDTGGDGVDTLIGIWGVIGSAYDDFFIGTTGDNAFTGGDGSDTVSYETATAGVSVDLIGFPIKSTGGAGNDYLSSIENLVGSSFADRLLGNDDANLLIGGAGDDFLFGSDGDDILTGGAGHDGLNGGGGFDLYKDTIAGFDGDTINGMSVGDRILFTDANLANFSFTVTDWGLSYSGGALGFGLPLSAGYHLQASATAQGVALGLVLQNNGLSGDFNGDGKDDLLWRSDTGQMSNWLGRANGGFVSNDVNAFVSVPTNWRVVGAGDFNGDGRDDIVWRSDSGQMSNWLGKANGGWTANDANALAVVDPSWKIVGTGDFNGDGKDDLLWRSVSGQLSNWLGKANGGFSGNDANAFVSVPNDWHVVGVGDFNGDGRDDILWRSDAGQLSNWLGTASGGWAGNDANAFTDVSTTWHVIGVGDFNGDGRSDILWRSGAGQLSNWLGQANGGFVGNDANALVSIPIDWEIASVGDYNGDGRDDILWRHTGGAMSNWLGTASGGWAANDANALQFVPPSWQIQADGMFGV